MGGGYLFPNYTNSGQGDRSIKPVNDNDLETQIVLILLEAAEANGVRQAPGANPMSKSWIMYPRMKPWPWHWASPSGVRRARSRRFRIVDSTLLAAWWKADPGAAWQRYAGKAHLFGYKVHTVLCRQANLPVFVLATPANVHDSLVGWLILLVAAILYGFRVLVVVLASKPADAAYFERRFFWVVFDILGAHAAVDYNLRQAGKRKLAQPFFLRQRWRLVIRPRTDIEHHLVWIKRYIGLKYFQCFIFLRVSPFILLTYNAALAVALAAQRYNRPRLVRSRSMVLAHV